MVISVVAIAMSHYVQMKNISDKDQSSQRISQAGLYLDGHVIISLVRVCLQKFRGSASCNYIGQTYGNIDSDDCYITLCTNERISLARVNLHAWMVNKWWWILVCNVHFFNVNRSSLVRVRFQRYRDGSSRHAIKIRSKGLLVNTVDERMDMMIRDTGDW